MIEELILILLGVVSVALGVEAVVLIVLAVTS